MRRFLLNSFFHLDGWLAKLQLWLGYEAPGLVVLGIHCLFEDQAEEDQNLVFPQEFLKVNDLDRLLSYFASAGYQFVSPSEIVAGLDPAGRYLLLTFDDGYAHHLRALPVLAHYEAPGAFFIPTSFVARPRKFWWDAHYAGRRKQGWDFPSILAEQNQWKTLGTKGAEEKVKELFGQSALQPKGEIDRPFSVAELQKLAAHPLATVGNHSHDHLLLTDIDPDELTYQLARSQALLNGWLGAFPQAIVYPNGNQNAQVQAASQKAGLEVGFSGRQARCDLRALNLLAVPRLFLYGVRSLPTQVVQLRAPWSLRAAIRRVRSR
jgi:peptidoglycan/xylan/chitin deacetylase (PgdA/CDA1 family)